MQLLSFNGKEISQGVSLEVLGKSFELEAKKNPGATVDDISWCGLLEWRGPEGSVKITHADQSQSTQEFSGKPVGSRSIMKNVVLLRAGDVVHIQTKAGQQLTLTVEAHQYKVSPGLVQGSVMDVSERPDDSEELRAVRNWLRNGRPGVSSKTMSSVLYGLPSNYSDYDGPYDPSDFARCMEFLEFVPQARSRVHELSSTPGWENIAPAFDELEELYNQEKLNEDGKAPLLYARMQELRARPAVKRAKP